MPDNDKRNPSLGIWNETLDEEVWRLGANSQSNHPQFRGLLDCSDDQVFATLEVGDLQHLAMLA